MSDRSEVHTADLQWEQEFSDKMAEFERTRCTNKFHLNCPNCIFELMSIADYKQMERERVRDGDLAKEDRDAHLITTSDLGFCWNCGGFVHWLDYSENHPQYEAAQKAWRYRTMRSVGQSRSNQLRPFVKDARSRRYESLKKDEDGEWRMHGEPKRRLDEPDPDSTYIDKSLNPEWVAWYRQAKKNDIINAKSRMEYEEWIATDEGKAQAAIWAAERKAEREGHD